jgi:FkbM family methyltransferase
MFRAWKRRQALRSLLQDIQDGLAFASYAQEGEDAILHRFLEAQPAPGFYVDIGAHHPKRFSTTYAFYLKGWSGINVDAAPGSMAPFRELRPRDVNLELGVSDARGTLTFHIFNEPALNTFDAALARLRSTGPYRVERQVPIEVLPLREILDQHLPAGREITFLTVDVEGLDLEVLRSNDWERYRPVFVLVEHYAPDVRQLQSAPAVAFLEARGYDLVGRTPYTGFFRRRSLELPATTGAAPAPPRSS